jgi:hypothetical protein
MSQPINPNEEISPDFVSAVARLAKITLMAVSSGLPSLAPAVRAHLQ